MTETQLHRPPLAMFAVDTSTEEMARLMGTALTTIAGGWPALYFKQGPLQGSVPVIDLDAMIRDAGALAVELQKEIDRRTPTSALSEKES